MRRPPMSSAERSKKYRDRKLRLPSGPIVAPTPNEQGAEPVYADYLDFSDTDEAVDFSDLIDPAEQPAVTKQFAAPVVTEAVTVPTATQQAPTVTEAVAAPVITKAVAAPVVTEAVAAPPVTAPDTVHAGLGHVAASAVTVLVAVPCVTELVAAHGFTAPTGEPFDFAELDDFPDIAEPVLARAVAKQVTVQAVTESVAIQAVTERVAITAPPIITDSVAVPAVTEKVAVLTQVPELKWDRYKKFQAAIDPWWSIRPDDQESIRIILAARPELSPSELGAQWNARINEWKKSLPLGLWADPQKAPDFGSWFSENQRIKRRSEYSEVKAELLPVVRPEGMAQRTWDVILQSSSPDTIQDILNHWKNDPTVNPR